MCSSDLVKGIGIALSFENIVYGERSGDHFFRQGKLEGGLSDIKCALIGITRRGNFEETAFRRLDSYGNRLPCPVDLLIGPEINDILFFMDIDRIEVERSAAPQIDTVKNLVRSRESHRNRKFQNLYTSRKVFLSAL